MISDDDLTRLRAAHGETTAQWGSAVRHDGAEAVRSAVGLIAIFDGPFDGAHDSYNRDFAVMAHRLLPGLLARLEFAERCLADLHDETHAAGAVVRLRKALEHMTAQMEHGYRDANGDMDHDGIQMARRALEGR